MNELPLTIEEKELILDVICGPQGYNASELLEVVLRQIEDDLSDELYEKIIELLDRLKKFEF